ncbi:MAG TPA: hypothetical protein VNJ01_17665 [Bacteriovoracaceae bacterium]|nr:hypothetical protein [Bacteriovoracaceae bacterium]
MARKTAVVLLLSLLALSCNKGSGSSDVVDLGAPSGVVDDEANDNYVVPDSAYSFDSNIDLYYFSLSQEEKFNKAIEIIKLVVATEQFKRQVQDHTYQGARTYVDNGGYSNAQIYQIILDGAEKLQPVKNNSLDAEFEIYTDDDSNVVGYTYPTSNRIWVNTKYFNSYSPAGVAHNVFHEWLHKLGFKHATSYSPSRDYSVPYAIGDMIGDIGKNFL